MSTPNTSWRYALVGAVLSINACSAYATPQSAAANEQSRSSVQIDFRTEDDGLDAAVREYEQIWTQEADRIVEAMESVSGLRFVKPEYADTAIVANVVEAPSNSGYRDRPMRLRASYSSDTKRATLVHELGHRLQTHLFARDEEEHGPLFLWLYDVWVDLWGQTFADEQVTVEKRRGERYVRAWDAAMVLTREERQEAWSRLLNERASE